MKKKRLTSVRLTPETKRLLARLAVSLGRSQSAILDQAICEKAARHGLSEDVIFPSETPTPSSEEETP